MPPTVIAAAREQPDRAREAARRHLARVDQDLRALEAERRDAVARSAPRSPSRRRSCAAREESVREREETFRRRLDAKLDDQLRDARREIDTVIEELKARATELVEQAARRRGAGISTGEAGAVRADARAALERVVGRLEDAATVPGASGAPCRDRAARARSSRARA